MARELIAQLGYIGLGIKDVSAWEDFGQNILGMELKEKLEDGTMYFRMDEYHHRFIMEPTGEDDIKYAGWMVPTLDALNEVQARVQAAGVTVEEGSPEECAYRKVQRFITFKDPDDLRVEVFYGLDVDVHEPFHSPRAISGFKTGDMGIGHIVPSVKDMEVTERFYRDVLGFRISDYIDLQAGPNNRVKMTFMHVNARHHSFAFAERPGPKRLGHWMMQVNSIEDVGRTYDLVRQRGVPIRSALGTHLNDHMTSFYMINPSGFATEYGWGGREVDDDTWVVQQYHTGDVWGHEPPDRYKHAAADLPGNRS